MTRLDAYNPVSDTWEPFRGGTITPPPGFDRVGLFVTEAELSVWRQRAATGPYRSEGDTSKFSDLPTHAESPGDWDRIAAQANQFATSPTRIWNPNTGGSLFVRDRDNDPPLNDRGAHQVRDAGFYPLINTFDDTLADKVMSWLVTQSSVDDLDFSNTTIWPRPGHHPNEWFRTGHWLGTLYLAYDFARAAGGGTSAQRNQVASWFQDALGWIDGNLLSSTSNMWTDRFNFQGPGSLAVGYNGTFTHASGHESHTYARRHDNQRSTAMTFAGLASIGLGDTAAQANVKQWCKEWLFLCVHGDHDFQEMHRGWNRTSAESGYHYTNATFADVLLIAEAFARAGDFELYQFSTRGGFWNTACATGDPDKSLLQAAIGMSKYANDVHNRYHSSNTSSSNRIDGRLPRTSPTWRANRETHLALGNKYFNSATVKAAYLHDPAAGYPTYWRPTARYADWSGRIGLPGYLFMYGNLESLNVYPGT